MANNQITTKIICQNIAPLESLSKEITSNSLKIGILADNGSGKTFISRMFRLLEKKPILNAFEINKLISFNKQSAKFSFKIVDKHSTTIEDIHIDLNKNSIPSIPDTNLIYHIFNQDFVDENIKTLSSEFEKDGNIDGFILGKVNIDVSEDEAKLLNLQNEHDNLKEQTEQNIDNYRLKNLDSIQNIKRLNDYKKVTFENIIKDIDSKHEVEKTLEDWIDNYDKVKSIPENLQDIAEVEDFKIDFELIKNIIEDLKKVFKLSNLADDFKEKIKSKQRFIEDGIKLKGDNGTCPFCEQTIQDEALKLIDSYNSFIEDEESKVIKRIQKYIDDIKNYIKELTRIENQSTKQILKFDEYKNKYISSMSDIILKAINNIHLKTNFELLINKIEEKIKNINLTVLVEDNFIQIVAKNIEHVNKAIVDINKNIENINNKKNKSNDENLKIRKKICETAYIDLIAKYKADIKKIAILKQNITTLKEEIKRKKAQQRISKKDKVYSTIKNVLQYFFNDKYTLDKTTFRLMHNTRLLDNGQTKDVLSEGEKNIIAFAYYLGDIHLKINDENDYKKLFFVIDDPISSMDFNHVYTISGIIREIDKILKIEQFQKRLLIFTHNNEFMRVLSSNNIIETKLILKNGAIQEFNNNLTIPYINHLVDIYKIARHNELPTHTTANSIRHILETLIKFDKITLNKLNISEYIQDNIPKDKKTYTLINDLSHGGWRTEQTPISNDDFKDICEDIIIHIESKYSGQIDFCKTL